MAPRFEIAVGLRKGHKTTKISAGRKGITDKAIKIRPARLKGVSFLESYEFIMFWLFVSVGTLISFLVLGINFYFSNFLKLFRYN